MSIFWLEFYTYIGWLVDLAQFGALLAIVVYLSKQ
jgi:hypothetical protein